MRRTIAAILAFFLLSGISWAQRGRSVPDLTGFWERKDAAGSGSFGGIDAKIPKAVLVPGVQTAPPGGPPNPTPAGDATPHKPGDPYIVTNGRCGGGMPFMMGHSAALDIVQTSDEVLIIPEMPGTRHIYMDGRPHPPLNVLEPSTVGHSVGRWEGDTLVVDTIGLLAGGGVPGGGRRSPETHLVERYRVLDGGKQMSVTFTWQDPKIYAKPHTYEYIYYKDPPDTYALEEWCDSSDPLQKQSIVPPEQRR
jgi:hypothetical protein